MAGHTKARTRHARTRTCRTIGFVMRAPRNVHAASSDTAGATRIYTDRERDLRRKAARRRLAGLSREEGEEKKRARNAAKNASKARRKAAMTLQALAGIDPLAKDPLAKGSTVRFSHLRPLARKIPKEFEKRVCVHEGIRVRERWVNAVDAFLASEKGKNVATPRSPSGDEVERGAANWGELMVKGVYTCEPDDALVELVHMVDAIVKKKVNAAFTLLSSRSAEVRPVSVFVRPYSGGPSSVDELPRPHYDTLDHNGARSKSACFSVVLVLEGGVSDSGIDLALVTRNKRRAPLRLEAGDAVVLGPYVKHEVFFSTDVRDAHARDDVPLAHWESPTRHEWRRRLSIVAFYKME